MYINLIKFFIQIFVDELCIKIFVGNNVSSQSNITKLFSFNSHELILQSNDDEFFVCIIEMIFDINTKSESKQTDEICF